MPWIVAIAQAGREATARVNLEDQGFDVFLPRLPVSRIVAGRLVLREVFLFPRYLFVLARQRWSPILGTRGVSSVIWDGDAPARVPEDTMFDWISACDDDGVVSTQPEDPLGPTDSPIVGRVGTPYEGWAGLYRGMSGDDRVSVLIAMFGKKRTVTIPVGCVTRAAA